MCVRIDDVCDDIAVPNGKHNPPIYSLIVNELNSKIPSKWNSPEFVKSILSQTKSKYRNDNRWAALFAVICAKSKIYEVERFMYFWMAFNGIYGYFAKLINRAREKDFAREVQQIQWLLQIFGLGERPINRNDSAKLAQEAISIISSSDIDDIHGIHSLTNDIRSKLDKALSELCDISPEGYLLTSLPYYFRCNYFHAGSVVPLFCYADERELKCLHLLNVILEEFIDNNLYLLFDDVYVNKTYGNIIKNITIESGGNQRK